MSSADAPHAATSLDDAALLDAGRLARLRQSISDAGCDAGLFYDPVNIRYATGTSNMQVYSLHNPCRYVFVPADGDVVLFEFKGCEHLSDGHASVAEIRPAVSWYDFIAGPRTIEFAQAWAAEIVALLGGAGTSLAVDRLDPLGAELLRDAGVHLADGQRVANAARAIKTPEEIDQVRAAVAACDVAIDAMRHHLRPGRTEQEVWAELHRVNIEQGGEWLETRLLTSGPRTNPWYQECSSRVIESGDLVAFDTDLIGVGGYSVDVSRTWVAGDVAPSDNQQRLHAAAAEQLERNIALFRPGASFIEISHAAWLPSDDIHSVTNAAVAHGIGLCNEYPLILNRDHVEAAGYDGEVLTDMVICVEALAAPPGGDEGVKLEQQILVTAGGPEVLSSQSLALTGH